MPTLLRLALRWLPLIGLLLAGAWAGAAQRALLVGVSELAYQPASLWLQAPRNDVVLMRDALERQGFARADITVLADGVAGAALPDAQAIREALQRLLAQSRGGDFVVLYFSGHGTRLRDTTKRYQEPDGLAENFLARDVRGTIGGAGPLGGGVRDVDFDGWVQAFLAKDVFVWSVFDTCSAASMTRGLRSTPAQPADDEVRWRGLRSDQLARSEGGVPEAVTAAPEADAVPRARYVAFFASESHQVTPELRLPRGERRAQSNGLLTWAVAESLRKRPATWRELFDGVLARYPAVLEELETRFPERELPSPVAEGNLDVPLFSNTLEPLTTRPQWPVQRAGGRLSLDVGLLDGLEPQLPVQVVASLADGTQRRADAVLDAVALSGSQLVLPAALRDLPGDVQWSLVPLAEPSVAVLRVRADRPLPAGMSLAWPVAIRRAEPGAPADLRWVDAGRPSQRLESLARDGERADIAVPLRDEAAVRRQLRMLAQTRWFSRLAQLAPERRIDGFDAVLELWEGDRLLRSDPLPLAAGWVPPAAGQRLALLVRNASGQSIDLAVVAADGQGMPQSLYPERAGDANRFERGSAQVPALKRFELPASGGGRLWLVASPAAPHSAPRLFGMATALPLGDLRVRGQARPDRERQVLATAVRWGDAGR
jgi:hypothetical protein